MNNSVKALFKLHVSKNPTLTLVLLKQMGKTVLATLQEGHCGDACICDMAQLARLSGGMCPFVKHEHTTGHIVNTRKLFCASVPLYLFQKL